MQEKISDSILSILENLPARPGVYIMKDIENQVIYIGKAKCLKDRVKSYFQASTDHTLKIVAMVAHVHHIEYTETTSEEEAIILESRMIKEIQPKYNTRQKDGRSLPYLVITKEEYPRVLIGRESEYASEDFELYGPFLDGLGLRQAYKILQQIFRFRTCGLPLRNDKKKFCRPCLLFSVHLCSGPCGQKIDKASYCEDIESLRRFLQGERSALLESLQEKMLWASQNRNFERAAKFRDQIRALESLDKKQYFPGDFLPSAIAYLDPQESLRALQEVLHLAERPRIIEGVDIAHHSGHEAVGSLVTFRDGVPWKEGYRRYKIHSLQSNDDYAMIEEVLYRRFLGQDRDRPLPDILLIDGGKGQLSVAENALAKMQITLPTLLSLAKKEEEIYRKGSEEPLALEKSSIIHHLICYVRDEAHRFAQSYHHHLKSKKIKSRTKK